MTGQPDPASSAVPVPKVAAAGAAGAATIVLVYILSLFHVDMPDSVAAAIAVLISVGAGYLKKG